MTRREVFSILVLLHMSHQALCGTATNTAGDKDQFGSGVGPGENVQVNSIRREADDGDFDSYGRSSFSWTHSLDLPAHCRVVSAVMQIVTLDVEDNGAGDGRGGGPFDVRLAVNGMDVAGAFDDVYTPDGYGWTPLPPVVSTFVLPPEFWPSLASGTVSVTVNPLAGSMRDNIAIDYAELTVTYVPGPSIVQITDRSGGGGPCSDCCQIVHRQPVLNPQGDQFVFGSTWNPDGTAGNPNTNRNTEVFRYDIASGLYLEDTITAVGISMPFDFTDTLIAFVSSSPELSGNIDSNVDLFVYASVLGASPQAVTATTGPIPIDHGLANTCPSAWFSDGNWWTIANTHADISADDGFIAWAGNRNIPSVGASAGANADENCEIWLKDLKGGAVHQITQTTGGDSEPAARGANLWPRVNTRGGRVVFVSNRGADGSSVSPGRHGVFLWTPSGTSRLTTADITVEREFPAFGMDDGGTRVVFAADADLIGQNADGNMEIFAVSVPTGVVTQITDTAGNVTNSRPILSGDGEKLAFLSNGDFGSLELNADGSQELWVYHFDKDRNYDDLFVPVTSLVETPRPAEDRTHWMDWYSLDRDGSHLVMCTNADLTGQNSEHAYEIFLASFDWKPAEVEIIRVNRSNEGQVELEWKCDLSALRFTVEWSENPLPGSWEPVSPEDHWPIDSVTWTSAAPIQDELKYFRVRAE